MSCRHGWHDCGPWYGPSYDAGWYGPQYDAGWGPRDWYEPADRPIRRGYRRGRRVDRGPTAEDLEGRLAELRDEIGRLQAELDEARGAEAEKS